MHVLISVYDKMICTGPDSLDYVLSIEIAWLCLMNPRKMKMNGKEAEPYAIRMGILEFSANPRPRYIVNITQIIPMVTYSFVIKRNLSTSNWR